MEHVRDSLAGRRFTD